jgi:arsenite methyltransferase
LDVRLKQHPISNVSEFLEMEQHIARMRRTEPMIVDGSIDVVISNCVLNLVDPAAKPHLFGEIFRVLKPGGRAVISDIVSDRPVPAALCENPELWSGCISGALTESGFFEAFSRAGFGQIETLERQEKPWRVVEGTEFRSVTVQATKQNSAMAETRIRNFSSLPPLSVRKPVLPKCC